MERLTERINGQAWCAGECPEIKDDCECEHLHKMRDKLAEYEDLEEQGLLLRLPCKENEWVWIAHETRKCAYKVLYTCKSDILADMEEGYVFGYTKAEAEKELAEMGE